MGFGFFELEYKFMQQQRNVFSYLEFCEYKNFDNEYDNCLRCKTERNKYFL
jgi:hypothetical protein